MIKSDEFYTPNEITRMGVLPQKNIDSRKQFLLRHIRDGKVKAKNVGTEAKPRYIILGSDLDEYLKKK